MQVTKHVHAIKIPFQVPVGPGVTVDRFVYVYLIYGKKICLIDTGVASSEIAILDYLRKTERKPEDISMIVLTHSHPDHIGSVPAIKKVSGGRVAAHMAERAWIEDVELQSKERPVPGFHSLVAGSVDVDVILNDGDTIHWEDGLQLDVFHTPGHSNGSISIFFRKDRALFTGDAVPAPGDIPIYEDVLASVRSIKTLKDIDGIRVLLSSWDVPKEGDAAYQAMDEGLEYLQRIHTAVIKIADTGILPESLELCRMVLKELGIPIVAANPLVAKSFDSNVMVRSKKNLLIG